MLELEEQLQIQNYHVISVYTQLYGVESEVYQPQSPPESAIYDEEDQAYNYNDTLDFTGKLLITGMNELRFGILDRWSPDEIKLFYPVVDEDGEAISFVPKENARIDINDNNNIISARILRKKTITGQLLEIVYIYELVSFN